VETFTRLFGSLLLFVYHCFDRVVINGYLSGLSRPGQVAYFFHNVVGEPGVGSAGWTKIRRFWTVGRLFGSNRRRQIKEIPWRWPKGSIRVRIIGRPATFLMSGLISFTLFLWVPRLGAPNSHRQADLTIVETDT
jgi:hypothetical protein